MHKRVDDGLVTKFEIMSETGAGGNLLGASSRRQKMLHRLYVRRWLIAVSVAVLIVMELAFALPVSATAAAIGVIILSAGLIPREGLVRVTRTSLSNPAEWDVAAELTDRLITGLPEPAIVLGASGNVICYNVKAGEAYAGLKPERHISAVIRHPHILDAVARASPGEPYQTVKYTERVPIARHVAATVAWIGHGNARSSQREPSIMLFLKDLTEQERLDEMRSDFIANASHELKTPLASLRGFIETLQGPARQDEAARDRFLEIMLKQAERMSRLIDNLLSLSRVEMRTHIKPQTAVDLSEVLRHAAQTLEPLAKESGISLELEPSSGYAFALGDRDELIQVFQNLIHNAIKYGEAGTNVRVWIARIAPTGSEGARLAVSVADSGPGIAAQHLPRLTERFYRANDSARAEKSGTGLGLAIAQQVISRHRGELKIWSELGKGSTFTVILNESAEAPAEPY